MIKFKFKDSRSSILKRLSLKNDAFSHEKNKLKLRSTNLMNVLSNMKSQAGIHTNSRSGNEFTDERTLVTKFIHTTIYPR